MRIEPNMSTLKTQDLTNDRSRDARAQSLNPAAMEQEETKLRDEEIHRTQAVEEAEYARVEDNKREPNRQQSEDTSRSPSAEEEPLFSDEEETQLLQQEAADRLLMLPVDSGKFARREEHRIDVLL